MGRYKKISDYERLLRNAEEMLLNPTKAEKKLRIELIEKFKEADFKFQVVMVPFIVDNVSIKHRLIIEIDGSVHDHTKDSDEVRQRDLERDGYRFLRFTNDEVLNDVKNVLKLIEYELHKPKPNSQRTPYARTKKSKRFNKPPYPITAGDKSIIDPISGKPYRPDTDDEIEAMANSLAEEIVLENLQQKITNQQKLEKLKLFILRKKQDQEINKLRKFTCHNCGMDIKLNQPRIANRVNGEFIGWNHVSC